MEQRKIELIKIADMLCHVREGNTFLAYENYCRTAGSKKMSYEKFAIEIIKVKQNA